MRWWAACAAAALLVSDVVASKASLNCYFPSAFTDAAYQKTALDKVLKAWVVPRQLPAAGKKTVVQSSIGRDGKVIGAFVSLKSGVGDWDAAALAAVRKAGPFAPLPRSLSGSQIEVHWHFTVAP